MIQTKTTKKLGYGSLAVATIVAITFTVGAIPSGDVNAFELNKLFDFGTIDITASADDPKTHRITMSAESLPDGSKGYQMQSHIVETEDGDVDVTSKYSAAPSIPGPTIIIDEGDEVFVTLENNLDDGCVSIHTHGVHYVPKDDGTLSEINGVVDSCATTSSTKEYHWTAAKGTAGVWPYHDHTLGGELGAELEGLYGTLIVNSPKVRALVDGVEKNIPTNDLDKDIVLWMHGTSFFGMEIDYTDDGKQTPLWVNPDIKAQLGENVRFNVIGIGSEFHSFHIHGHRWLQDGTTNVIDVQNIGPLSRTSFVLQAGEGVGAGQWMYHCHVFAHMEAGMHGIFEVTTEDEPSVPGPSPFDGLVSFVITDEPGPWFRNLNPIPGLSESLAIASPGDTINFQMTNTNTVHTVTSLLWPVTSEDAEDPVGDTFFTSTTNMPFDQGDAFKGGATVTLEDPGLYVFTCKIHPYMFAAVIVDDGDTEGLDLGDNIRIVNGITAPSTSALALSLLKSFFIVTDPNNWQDYTTGSWDLTLPDVALNAGGAVVPLSIINANADLNLVDPATAGIGEVWVNTQFEKTEGKANFGTTTAVDTTTWDVTKKISLPDIKMNHPHNMWTNTDQDVIYQTMWFDNRLAVFDRVSGEYIDELQVGDSPSHVMTRPDGSGDVYVALNGDNHNDSVAKIDFENGDLDSDGRVDIGAPHPHGHWMDATTMVTPNVFTGDATAHEFDSGVNTLVGVDDMFFINSIFMEGNPFGIPIATSMHPSGDKYYVANLLDSSVTCVSIGEDPQCGADGDKSSIKQIPLLLGLVGGGLLDANHENFAPDGPVGLLPIQTPVSPDGKYVVTATLLPSITIIDTATDELVLSLPCDAGCHGVNFGAKADGGYYAYVSSKFSNALIVFDPEEAIAADAAGNENGVLDGDELSIVGKVLLTSTPGAISDDTVIALDGMGGQGVLAIPNPYDGWIEETVASTNLSGEVQTWVDSLSNEQKDPYP